jgi:signal transduction histidine kinase
MRCQGARHGKVDHALAQAAVSTDQDPSPDGSDFLVGGGEVGALMRAHDWSDSPLGEPRTWPQPLRTVAQLLLHSRFPMFVAWGKSLGFLYNDSYAEILGEKHPRALGRPFHEIWSEIWPDIEPLIDAALSGEATFREDLPLVMNRRGYDEQTWFTFSYSPVRDESGRVAGMFCACSETTQRVLAERRLRELNDTLEEQVRERTSQLERSAAALRQSQKMEAIGQLTGGIAHDFNNLLQTVVSNLETIQRSASADVERVQAAADSAMNGVRRGAALTQRLLAFARQHPLSPKPVDPNALVGGMHDMLQRTLGQNVQIELLRADDLWRVEVDPNELESALLNLAVNARDAMPHGGSLTIRTANASVGGGAGAAGGGSSAASDGVPDGHYVLVSVGDSGAGMDEATLERAFEPFFTTKAVGAGSGLGLSQVYGFVTQSSGHVRIESQPLRGTTVRIYLPRLTTVSGDEASPPAQETSPRVSRPRGRETILVVEDDAHVRRGTVDSLRELGYAVLEAHDGPSALAVVGGSDPIDLLFTDVVLRGGMSGTEVARQALVLRPALRVLFTTGYARGDLSRGGRLEPGVKLLRKPFTIDRLAAKLRDVLDPPAT